MGDSLDAATCLDLGISAMVLDTFSCVITSLTFILRVALILFTVEVFAINLLGGVTSPKERPKRAKRLVMSC